MTGGRVRRFPLGLEDLVREPRKAVVRPGGGARQGTTGAGVQPGPIARSSVAVVVKAPRATQKGIETTGTASGGRPPAVPKPTAGFSRLPGTARPSAADLRAGATASKTRPAAPAPAGAATLTSERVRERMVERLRANGVSDARVLAAMASVPRHLFVDAGLATQAYEDAALPIGHHQTISKPSVVARMIELAAAGRPLASVLEIGTGCGYQAAVLSQVAREVYSIERVKPLYERAKTNLRPLRIPNIRLHYGDGRIGLPAAAPFDAIVIAAAGLEVPQALLDQLAPGGRLVAPVGGQGDSQVLVLFERIGPAQWRESRLDRVFFVPLKSGVV